MANANLHTMAIIGGPPHSHWANRSVAVTFHQKEQNSSVFIKKRLPIVDLDFSILLFHRQILADIVDRK